MIGHGDGQVTEDDREELLRTSRFLVWAVTGLIVVPLTKTDRLGKGQAGGEVESWLILLNLRIWKKIELSVPSLWFPIPYKMYSKFYLVL